MHVGHARWIERLAGDESEPRFDLRGVGFGLPQLRAVSVAEMRTSTAPCGHARAALDRRLDHAAGGLGADFGLLVGDERSRDAQKAIDRLALRPPPRGRRPARAPSALPPLVVLPLHAAERPRDR